MVSLAPSQGQGQGRGGFFFGHGSDRDSVSILADDVDLLNESNHLYPVVIKANFIPLYTSWIAGFEALLLVVFEVMVFVLAQVLKVKILGGRDPSFSFLTLLHVVLWFIVMVCHYVLNYQHKELRLRGYLMFVRRTMNLRLIPPLVFSFGNAVLLVFFAIRDNAGTKSFIQHDYYFLQLVYSLEFVIVLPTLIYHIVKEVSFYKERSWPDAYTIIDNNLRLDAEREIGYRENESANDILEKQADMIRYLQQHNENLSRRLLRQSSQA